MLKDWGISDDYVGIGHCILGYPDDFYTAKPKNRKADYITFVK